MGSYNLTSWTELGNVLNSIGQTEYEVELNLTGDFGTPDTVDENKSFLVRLPVQVTRATINGDTAEVYKARIMRPTSTTSALELIINNLNLQINDNYHCIDIAEDKFLDAAKGFDYNRIIFKGNNNINNYIYTDTDKNNCGIHVPKGTGLYIVCELASKTNILVSVKSQTLENIATSSGIGGRKNGNSGYVDLNVNGELNVNVECYTGSNASSAGAGIGGGSSFDAGGGDCGIVNIHGNGVLSVISEGKCNTGAAIGAGSSYTGIPGEAGEVNIYGGVTVNACSKGDWESGVGIGGGGSYWEQASAGGVVKIYGDSKVNIISDGNLKGAGIGGGSSYWEKGGDGGNVEVYGNAVLNVSSIGDKKGVAIGGGDSHLDIDGGNVGNIDIYENAQVIITVTKDSVGMGSLSPSIDTDNINIRDQAPVIINYENGIGIEKIRNLQITTANLVSITSSGINPNYAIEGDNIYITEVGPMSIPGGIKGKLVKIHDKLLALNKLDYDSQVIGVSKTLINSDSAVVTAYQSNLISGFDFDNGYVIVEDTDHIQSLNNRTDYFTFNYTLNNAPYTGGVRLLSSSDRSVNEEVSLGSDGILRIYMSDGSYFFATSPDGLYRTVDVASPNLTPGQLETLAFSKSQSRIIGSIALNDSDNHSRKGIRVELFDENLNSTGLAVLTDENGNYTFNNPGIGEYYVYYGNIPNDYKIEETDAVNINGLSKNSYLVDGINDSYADVGVLAANQSISGSTILQLPSSSISATGFLGSSIEMINSARQIIRPRREIAFGNISQVSGGQLSILMMITVLF